MLWDSMHSCKAFLAGCKGVFPANSCWDTWRSGSWLARGQVNMADEANLHQSSHSTSEVLVVWHVSICCYGELGPFCWLISATDIAIFGASHQDAEHTSQMKWLQWYSESWGGSDQQQTVSKPWPFLVQVCLWEVFWSFFSVQPLSWSPLSWSSPVV